MEVKFNAEHVMTISNRLNTFMQVKKIQYGYDINGALSESHLLMYVISKNKDEYRIEMRVNVNDIVDVFLEGFGDITEPTNKALYLYELHTLDKVVKEMIVERYM